MRKVQLITIFLVAIFTFIFSEAPSAAEIQFRWQNAVYVFIPTFDPVANSWTGTYYQKVGMGKKNVKYCPPMQGCVNVLIGSDFFGKNKDAVVLWKQDGSDPAFLSYWVYFLSEGQLALAKSEQGIPRGELFADGDILQLWSGVRMWILLNPEGKFVTRELPSQVLVQTLGKEIGDQVVEFEIENGEVIFRDPSILASGLRIKSGKDLVLRRMDYNSGGEKIEFAGSIERIIKFPNASTIKQAECEVCIMPDGNPLQEKRFKLRTY